MTAELRTHPKRLWMAFLPFVLGMAVFAALSFLKSWFSPPWAIVLLVATILLAVVEGILISFVLRGVRRRESQALQLQAIYEVLSKISGSPDLQAVLDDITRLTVEVTGVRGCSIKLTDGTGPTQTMRVRSMAGIHRNVADLSVDAARNIYARSLLEGRPVVVEGAQASDFPELDGEVESLVCVPLRREGAVVGALCLYGEKGRNLPQEVLSFLSRLGDVVSISIANASVYDSLKRIDEAKTWFLLKASHELKSPLASIQSICQTVLEGYLGDVPEKLRELVERIRFRSSLLVETANDLLVLAKARTVTVGQELETVEPCSVLDETVKFFRPAALEKGVDLRISNPCKPALLAATHEGLRSIMSNLISNAIKYSPRGSTVSVSLDHSDGVLSFTVRDSGIGIPRSEQDELFKEFFRASNARAATESGTGLGLTIVKSVVDSLGGTITVTSDEGRGTTVTVVLGRRSA